MSRSLAPNALALFVATTVMVPHTSLAAGYDYPELMVTPLASKRLEMEAKAERRNQWSSFLPIQVSGLTTLVAGAIQSSDVDTSKDANEVSPIAGMVVGGGWLIASTYLSFKYKPYSPAYRKIAKMGATNKKDRLTRERLAEEALMKPARLAKRLMWLSTITNFGISLWMFTKAKKESLGGTVDLVSAGVALAPLIFSSRWIQTARDHRNYKKRIYGPVAGMGIHQSQNGSLSPMASLQLSF